MGDVVFLKLGQSALNLFEKNGQAGVFGRVNTLDLPNRPVGIQAERVFARA
jgi:hypothetical protein